MPVRPRRVGCRLLVGWGSSSRARRTDRARPSLADPTYGRFGHQRAPYAYGFASQASLIVHPKRVVLSCCDQTAALRRRPASSIRPPPMSSTTPIAPMPITATPVLDSPPLPDELVPPPLLVPGAVMVIGAEAYEPDGVAAASTVCWPVTPAGSLAEVVNAPDALACAVTSE